MTPRLHGLYSTSLYLPFSLLSRHLRAVTRKLRGKSSAHVQPTKLPQTSWKTLPRRGAAQVWDLSKRNGNVRPSEVAILSAAAAGCPDGEMIFEIGTFDGRTTLNLALNSAPGCRVITLDLPPDHPTAFQIAAGERHMIDKPRSGERYEAYQRRFPEKIGRIHQLYGDSATFDYTPYWDSCGLVFVDGSHAYDYVMADSRTAIRLARNGAIILWHDYGIWGGVTRALEELEERHQLGLTHIRGTSLVYWAKPLSA